MTALLAGAAVTGCGGGKGGGNGGDPPVTTSPPVTVSPPLSPGPAGTTTEPAPPGTSATQDQGSLPARLVGDWKSEGGNALIFYRFRRDGTFSNASVLNQQRASGVFEFIIDVSGTAETDGGTLTLRVTSGTHTRKDPDAPSGDYTRPARRETETYAWSVSGSVLTMRDDSSGNTITYDRQ
ncbi:hypothetical protein [Spirillospora sp. NPDC047279]|uniref:hypothetical protein n=1 Tax=Spirillospora sp. NPDC047279 TaxID=3155478 RepID=UPI003403DC8C